MGNDQRYGRNVNHDREIDFQGYTFEIEFKVDSGANEKCTLGNFLREDLVIDNQVPDG